MLSALRPASEYFASDWTNCRPPPGLVLERSRPLSSRPDYKQLWVDWQLYLDFRVLECRSSNQAVATYGDVAVFTHDGRTRTSTSEGEETLLERETIVLRRTPDGGWLAVHEHPSPMPDARCGVSTLRRVSRFCEGSDLPADRQYGGADLEEPCPESLSRPVMLPATSSVPRHQRTERYELRTDLERGLARPGRCACTATDNHGCSSGPDRAVTAIRSTSTGGGASARTV